MKVHVPQGRGLFVLFYMYGAWRYQLSGKAESSSAFFIFNMNLFKTIFTLLIGVLFTASCASPTYLTPDIKIEKKALVNKATFSVQNLDQNGKIEPQSLTTHYDGFDVRYKIGDKFVVSLEIANNTNKSLIIDKSKCYVLYNGYSSDLFKDVRSSRSTTFNNVQDAINNVQTSDASIIMTIPPYSKWELPVAESNVKSLEKFPDFIEQPGTHTFQPYDNPEPVEFVIPYSFDYAMGKWDTSRNRIYVGQVDVEARTADATFTGDLGLRPILRAQNFYEVGKAILVSDNKMNKEEIDKMNLQNITKWKSHRHQVIAGRIFWGIVTLPILGMGGWLPVAADMDDCNVYHRPLIYNSDGTNCGRYNKRFNYQAEY